MSKYNYCDGCGTETKDALQMRQGAAGGTELCKSCTDGYDQDELRHEQSYDEPSHSTCESCGTTEPTDDWHRFYGSCGYCVQDVSPEHRPDQSDNQSAATALSHTLQAPPDRAGDQNRRPGY